VYQLKNEFPTTHYFVSRVLKQLFYLMPYSSGFFGINIVKEQRDFGIINCLSTVNEKFHLHFHSYMDANVWKTSRIAMNRSASDPENSNLSAIEVNLTCDMFSENIRIPLVSLSRKWSRWFLPYRPLTYRRAINDSSSHLLKSKSFFPSLQASSLVCLTTGWRITSGVKCFHAL